MASGDWRDPCGMLTGGILVVYRVATGGILVVYRVATGGILVVYRVATGGILVIYRVATGGILVRGLASDSFVETSLQWRAVANTAPDFAGPGIEPQTSRTDSNILTTELTGLLY